jgi:peptidoglycan LD-endopeptidase CwlK
MDRLEKAVIDGVDHRLIKIAQEAEKLLPFSLRIIEGMRSRKTQAQNMKNGVSLTLASLHLDGRAIDIAPVIKGEVSWDWNYFYPIADAMRAAAIKLKVDLTWGGCWDRTLNNLKPGKMLEESNDYVARRRKIAPKKKILTDGPHFQLVAKKYPRAIPFVGGTASLVVPVAKRARPAQPVPPAKPPVKAAVKTPVKPAAKKAA